MTLTSRFSGKTAIVTGAGSGIGRATALALASGGASVVVADIDPLRAKAVVAEIEATDGVAVEVVGDLAEEEVVEEIVRRTLGEYSRIDILVNNAGIMDSMCGPQETSSSEWDRVMRVNVTAPFLLTRAVAPAMIAAGRGSIVNVGSEAGLRGSCAGTAYTTSKHAIVGLTKSSAIMLRPYGVRVNCVAPGGTITNIQVTIDPDTQGPAVLGAFRGNVGRMAEAEEVASAIVYLASDEASALTGVTLPADSGWSAI